MTSTQNTEGAYVPVVQTTDRNVFSISPRPAGEFTKGDGQVIKFKDAHTLRVVAISGSGASKITVASISDLVIIRKILDLYINQNK